MTAAFELQVYIDLRRGCIYLASYRKGCAAADLRGAEYVVASTDSMRQVKALMRVEVVPLSLVNRIVLGSCGLW